MESVTEIFVLKKSLFYLRDYGLKFANGCGIEACKCPVINDGQPQKSRLNGKFSSLSFTTKDSAFPWSPLFTSKVFTKTFQQKINHISKRRIHSAEF